MKVNGKRSVQSSLPRGTRGPMASDSRASPWSEYLARRWPCNAASRGLVLQGVGSFRGCVPFRKSLAAILLVSAGRGNGRSANSRRLYCLYWWHAGAPARRRSASSRHAHHCGLARVASRAPRMKKRRYVCLDKLGCAQHGTFFDVILSVERNREVCTTKAFEQLHRHEDLRVHVVGH
jgi:hypothetical protein